MYHVCATGEKNLCTYRGVREATYLSAGHGKSWKQWWWCIHREKKAKMHADAVIHTYSHDDSTMILAAETGRDHLYFYHRRHIFSEKEDKSGAISQPIRRMVVLSETGGGEACRLHYHRKRRAVFTGELKTSFFSNHNSLPTPYNSHIYTNRPSLIVFSCSSWRSSTKT